MNLTALSILFISTFTHALWNLMGKREQRPSKEFFFLANFYGSCLLLPVLYYSPLVFHYSLKIWGLILLAGIFETIYFGGLAKIYRQGDISIAYPISRALPAILVIIFNIIFHKGPWLSLQFLIGSGLIFLGCIFIIMKNWRDFTIRNYLNYFYTFVAITAMGSAGYLIVDDQALHLLRINQPIAALAVLAIFYSFIRGVTTSICLAGVIFIRSRHRQNLQAVFKASNRSALFAGFNMYFTYTLVLLSMNLVKNVSYIATFRQLSIPLTAIAGIYFFKEPKPMPKIIGIGLMFVGVVAITLA